MMDKKENSIEVELEKRYSNYEKSRENQDLRENAWKEKECVNLYSKLIQCAGGKSVVRAGMRGKAKQLAITCYIKGIEPDYESFKISVEDANKIDAERKNRRLLPKPEGKKHQFDEDFKKIDEILDKIFKEFGVEIPFLSTPLLVEDAIELYENIKVDKSLRNCKLF